MGWQLSVLVIPQFVGAVVAFAVAGLVWSKRDRQGSVALTGMMVAAGWWSLMAGLRLAQTDLFWKLLINKAMYLGITLAPVAYFVFIAEYTGRNRWRTRPYLGALLVLPAISIVTLATNEPNGIHSLFWITVPVERGAFFEVLAPEWGPMFYVHAIYSYGLLAAGSYWLLELAVLSDQRYRTQAIGLFLAVLVPWSANVVSVAGLAPEYISPTSLGIVAGGSILVATIYRHQLLQVVPAAREMARKELVETIDDPVIVVDGNRRVVDLNPAAGDIFDLAKSEALGEELGSVSPDLDSALNNRTGKQPKIDRERDNTRRYYEVQRTSLSRGFGAVSGTLLTLRDVTEQYQRQQRLNVLNRVLRHNLRNVVTTIRGNAEYVENETTDEEIAERMAVIESNADAVIAQRDKLDSVLRALDRHERASSAIRPVLASLADEYRTEYPAADITIDVTHDDLTVPAPDRIRIAVEELLSNALDHGDVGDISVQITARASDGSIQIEVRDNGPGIPTHELEPILNGRETPLSHSSGVGLWLVNWIVDSLGGTVTFEAGEGGTTVSLSFPAPE